MKTEWLQTKCAAALFFIEMEKALGADIKRVGVNYKFNLCENRK
jgi:hypothetical protein